MKKFTVAIIGLGARGLHTYAKYQDKFPQRMKIIAVADIDKNKVKLAAEKYSIPEDMCFCSAEQLLSKGKLADVLIVATQDRQHKNHALLALEKGYDLLLEKPIAALPEDCIEIRNKANLLNKKVVVCHVLRYTAFYNMIKQLITEKKIGEPVIIQAIEKVGYWHQAHSFVRGNWRNEDIETPMILQKCCHDFDIISWLLGKKCISVSSIGSLKYFKTENAPVDSAEYCVSCKYCNTCPYSAIKIYLEQEDIGFNNGNREWPCDIVVENPTKETLLNALKTSPYGKCVFKCDNSVVDHQAVQMQFEDDVTVDFIMTAFTYKNAREIKVCGTLGEIYGNQTDNTVTLMPFGGKAQVFDINKIADDLSGHGGGDMKMMTEMFKALESGGIASSNITDSVHSHLIAFGAEKSRKLSGKVVMLDEFDKLKNN